MSLFLAGRRVRAFGGLPTVDGSVSVEQTYKLLSPLAQKFSARCYNVALHEI